MHELINLLLSESGVSIKDTLHSRTRITYLELYTAILSSDNLDEASCILKVSPDTLKHLMSRIIRPIFEDKKSKTMWKTYFLQKIDKKVCAICQELLPISDFGKHGSYCKDCVNTYVSIYKEENPYIDKNYYINNRNEFKARNAQRRAAKIHATVGWADLSKIKQIYLDCPEGYHVDHIIPLQGELVCGLHVESNLQYLTPFENYSKGNKFNP